MLSYDDELLNGDDKFIRTINNKKYIYKLTGELELMYQEKPTKYITKINAHGELSDKFLTLDIETLTQPTHATPYGG